MCDDLLTKEQIESMREVLTGAIKEQSTSGAKPFHTIILPEAGKIINQILAPQENDQVEDKPPLTTSPAPSAASSTDDTGPHPDA